MRSNASPDHPTSGHASPAHAGTLGRRSFLAVGGSSVVALVAAACSGSESTTAGSTSTTTAGATSTTASSAAAAGGATTTAANGSLAAFTAADFASLGTCVLLPEQTAGPFPLDEQLDRRDITEDYDGRPLRLGLRVVDDACAAIAGAQVEIWHADATGDYSAFTDDGGGKDEGSGTTFLRGTQTADADGIVEFLTIVPGWYRGRAVHIHLRVHVDGDIVRTSQLYFDADQIATVYADAPYSENGLPDTSNETDNIAGDPAGEGTLLDMLDGPTTRGAGSVALLNLGIN